MRVAALLLSMLLCAGCARSPSEQALREAVDALQAAVDARDAQAVSETLASDFIGPDGLDRDGGRRLAALHFMRNREVGVRTGPLEVAMQDRHATVRFEAVLAGGQGGLMPDSAQAYGVESGWRFEDGAWKLTSVRWTPRL